MRLLFLAAALACSACLPALGQSREEAHWSHTISDPRVYGETAVVVAVITDRWRDTGGEHSYRERIFDVWQKKRGGWRLVASKPNKVPEQ